jgi:hypothetical protein
MPPLPATSPTPHPKDPAITPLRYRIRRTAQISPRNHPHQCGHLRDPAGPYIILMGQLQ